MKCPYCNKENPYLLIYSSQVRDIELVADCKCTRCGKRFTIVAEIKEIKTREEVK